MKLYVYQGPVFYFDTCIDEKWKGSTYAVSEKKARNNLEYQYKMKNNYARNSKITLPGRIIIAS